MLSIRECPLLHLLLGDAPRRLSKNKQRFLSRILKRTSILLALIALSIIIIIIIIIVVVIIIFALLYFTFKIIRHLMLF
jgi:hypothetical protein